MFHSNEDIVSVHKKKDRMKTKTLGFHSSFKRSNFRATFTLLSLMTLSSVSGTTGFPSQNTQGSMNERKLSPWPLMTIPDDPLHNAMQNDVVWGNVNYCAHDVTLVTARRDLGGTDSTLEGAKWDIRTVPIKNGRLSQTSYTLDKNGFQLISNKNSKQAASIEEIDFLRQPSVLNNYYPICEDIVQKATGAAFVKAFDHNVRSTVQAGNSLKGQDNIVVQQPAGVVHNDYSRTSGPRRLRQQGQPATENDVWTLRNEFKNSSSLLDPDLVQDAFSGKRRYAFINVWRNIRSEPVQSCPLACVDAANNHMKDLLVFQIVYSDRVGENCKFKRI